MNKLNVDLKSIGIESLNDLQKESLEKHLEFHNIMMVAPTGSGKSIAFLLPAIEKLENIEDPSTEVLILAPSRELSLQIEDVYRSLKTGSKITTLYGGHSFRTELQSLTHPSKFVVATPGRLADHIYRKTINLEKVHHLIIDEFDKMLEMGFLGELEEIFEAMPSLQSITMTSATSNCETASFMEFDNPCMIVKQREVERKLTSYVVDCTKSKLDTLYNLLATTCSEPTLIFCNFREATEDVSDFLWEQEVVNEFYHGGMEQQDRERVLVKLRNGSTNVLVTTDLAARGLDIDNLKYVIHYQLPQNEEAYVHRSGRVARMNKEGKNFVICEDNEILPDFVDPRLEHITVQEPLSPPPYPKYETLYIGAGKKQKISKSDIVGFLIKIGRIENDQIGMITIRDNESYVAISNCDVKPLSRLLRGERLKKQKCRFDIAR